MNYFFGRIGRYSGVSILGASMILLVMPVGDLHAATGADVSAQSNDYLRIFYYREGTRARASLFQNPTSIDVLAPQAYAVDAKGALKGEVKDDIIAFAEKNGIKLMPLVTNGSFSKASLAILDDEKKQDALIDAMVLEGMKHRLWGWQFDFEGMDLSYRDRYSRFIKRATKTLKQNNFVVSVAVIAQVSSNPDDYPKNLWQRVVGAYDYAALAPAVDFISVMSYDDPTSKGPVAGYAWMKKVIEYSLKFIPREKLSLGIPLYYWQWDDTCGKLVGIGGYQSLMDAFRKYRPVPRYSLEEHAPYITYVSKKKQYSIWYENKASIKKKLDLILSYNLNGFSAWVLGTEVPTIHDAVKKN